MPNARASVKGRKIPYGVTTMAAIQRRVDDTAQDVADIARHATEYAKANRPWIDRTGDARRLLRFDVDTYHYGPGKVRYRLVARHGVPYGVFLENRPLDHGGRPILRPTLDVFTPLLSAAVRHTWKPYPTPNVSEVLAYMGRYAAKVPS